MKSIWKLLALAAVAAIFVPGLAVAHSASFEATRVAAAGMCGCCPASCGGGTYYACYNTITMPGNAVTCSYKNSSGGEFDCLSCMSAATPAEAHDVFLQELSSQVQP